MLDRFLVHKKFHHHKQIFQELIQVKLNETNYILFVLYRQQLVIQQVLIPIGN